ncbi:MAG: hypothetical protein V2B18_02730 [Pseudomonadota bacterium]
MRKVLEYIRNPRKPLEDLGQPEDEVVDDAEKAGDDAAKRRRVEEPAEPAAQDPDRAWKIANGDA